MRQKCKKCQISAHADTDTYAYFQKGDVGKV